MSLGTLTVTIQIDSISVLQAVLAAIQSVPGATAPPPIVTPPAPTPTPPPAVVPPADINVYPLTMQPVANPGDPVTLGVGPDLLQLHLNAGVTLGDTCEIAVFLNDKLIAAPLTVTGYSGMDHGQVFSIRGAFGAALPHVKFVGSGIKGSGGLWYNSITYNYDDLVTNDPYPWDNNGTMRPPNSTGVWNLIGRVVTFGPPIAVAPPAPVPPPVPETPPSTITGATINGSAAPASTLADLIAMLATGSILVLPAGTFHSTALVTVPCTIQGAGMGQTILDGTGMRPTHDKACLVPAVAGVIIKDMTIQNWHIPASEGANAAGVRQDADGITFTLNGVEIAGCDNGLLTFGAPGVTINNCNLHDNGAGAAGGGNTHEQYFGGGSGSAVVETNTTATCGAQSTHALKSRAAMTSVKGGTYTGNAHDAGGAYAGAVVDIPNGGVLLMDGATLVIPVGDGNTLFLNYGVNDLLYPDNSATLKNCVLMDQSGTGGILHCNKPGITLNLDGVTYPGSVPPQLEGWAGVTGEITKASP